jgi:hypothetical protein
MEIVLWLGAFIATPVGFYLIMRFMSATWWRVIFLTLVLIFVWAVLSWHFVMFGFRYLLLPGELALTGERIGASFLFYLPPLASLAIAFFIWRRFEAQRDPS